MRYPMHLSIVFVISLAASASASDAEGSPSPDYLALVRAYADAMIEKGRDTYGKQHSPLFAAALDRKTMTLGSARQFGSIPGVREHDRSIGGANPNEAKPFYGILYRLTEVTGEQKYAAEADKALEFFFKNCQSPKTGLMAWGEHLYWDFEKEACAGRDEAHEIKGAWPFWDRCYALAPDASWKFALGQWDHQVADKKTGDFSRHARWSRHGPQRGSDFPRYAGQMILDWADAYQRDENKNRPRREEMITAITLLTRRMEENMAKTKSGHLPALRGADYGWMTSNLELARCLWIAAPKVPETLAERMKTLAIKQDENFHKAPHKITEGGGFAVTIHMDTGRPRHRAMNKPYSATWSTGYGYGTHAGVANDLFARWQQLHKSHPDLAAKHRTLILAAADIYLDTMPDTDELQKPKAFDDVIDLMLNAYEITNEKKYLSRADTFARMAVKLFLDDVSPLPKATSRHDHYEAITGGPKLMRSLLRLHEAHRAAK